MFARITNWRVKRLDQVFFKRNTFFGCLLCTLNKLSQPGTHLAVAEELAGNIFLTVGLFPTTTVNN